MFARHDMHHFVQQIVGAGMGWFIQAHLADAAQSGCGFQRMPTGGKALIAGNPDIYLHHKGQCQKHQRAQCVASKDRPAAKRQTDEQRRGAPMVPARHGFQLRIHHRSGVNRDKCHDRADPAQRWHLDFEEDIGGRENAHHRQGANGHPCLARQPAGAPLGKGLERIFRITEVESRGNQPAHRQCKGDKEVRESSPPLRAGGTDAKPGQKAKTKAGKDGKEDYGWCGMHLTGPPVLYRANRGSPWAYRQQVSWPVQRRPHLPAYLWGGVAGIC